MARINRIVQEELEDVVTEGMRESKTQPEILKALNEELAWRCEGEKKKRPPISKSSLERYLAALPKSAVDLVHTPKNAEAAVRLVLNFGGQYTDLNEKLLTWLEDAQSERVVVGVTQGGEPIHGGPNWQARLGVAQRIQKHLAMYVDMAERIYNAKAIQDYQEAVTAAIADADPETARKINARLQLLREARSQAILGEVL